MTEEQFNEFIDHIAGAAYAFNEIRMLDCGPVVSAKWEPDADGFSRIEVGLRWLERTPLDELDGDELVAETARRAKS